MREIKMKKISLYIILFSLLVSLSLFFTGCGSTKSEANSTSEANGVNNVVLKAVNVTVKEVKPSLIRDVLMLPGELGVFREVRVGAGIGGKIEWIGPKEGQTVTKGTLLVKIDISALKASIDKAQAGFELADEIYKRRLKLYERKIIPREGLDMARTERTLAQGNLKQLRVQYDNGFIKAPISGQINHLYLNEGEFVGMGMPLLDIVDISKVKVYINVPEMDVRYLSVGQKVLVSTDAFKDRDPMVGLLSFIAYKADPATKTFRVDVTMDNPEGDLRAGMIGRVIFLKAEIKDALVAPLSALVDKNGERLVFVEKDGIAEARTVSIGVIERDKVQILEGLEKGDHLIVTGQSTLEEGMRVKVR